MHSVTPLAPISADTMSTSNPSRTLVGLVAEHAIYHAPLFPTEMIPVEAAWVAAPLWAAIVVTQSTPTILIPRFKLQTIDR